MASFTCATCGRELSSSSNLKRHQEHVHGKKQSCCPECFKTFGRHDDLLRHWRKFHDAASLSHFDQILDKPLSYDETGRVTASEWTGQGATPPCPPFMIHVVESLKLKFPDTKMASVMYLCPVHRIHHIPILRVRQPLDEAEYMQQYVPTIKCLDCTDEYLLIPSSSVLGIAEDHFSSSEHIRRVKLRWVTDSGIVRDTSNWMLPLIPEQRMAMADLMSREWSLSALDYELSFRHYDSLIIRAVKKYAIQILQVLLEEKLNASSVDILGRSALHWACKLGEYGKAELLIQHGLRLHSRDARHTTPLDLAVDAGGINPAVALVEAESRAESTEPMLRCITPLAIACRCNRDDVVHEIIKRGGDVNGTGSDSPLDMALRWGDPALVRLLLERGAKLSSVAASDRVLLQRGRHLDYIGSDQLYRKPLYRDANEKIAILQQHTTWKPLERARAGGTSRYSGR